MSKSKTHAFTLIELLVVISIIALLIGILLPALGAARKTARQMKNSTQIRGIHQAFFTESQENKGWFAGINSSGVAVNNLDKTFKDNTDYRYAIGGAANAVGQYPHARWATLVWGNYVSAEYLVSPGEYNQLVDPTIIPTKIASGATLNVNDPISSYSMPQLTNASLTGASEGRAFEWRDNANAMNPVISDRVVPQAGGGGFDPAFPDTHLSVWSRDSATAGEWNGGLVYNDGHTEFSVTSRIEGVGANGVSAVNPDNLFHRDDLDENRASVPAYSNLTPATKQQDYSMIMIVRDRNQKQVVGDSL